MSTTTEHSIINKEARDAMLRKQASCAIEELVFLAEIDDWQIYLDPGSPGLRYLLMSCGCKPPHSEWASGRPGERLWKTLPPSVNTFLMAHLELFPPPPPADLIDT